MKSKTKMRAGRFQTLDTTDSESVHPKDQNQVYETLISQSGLNLLNCLKPKYTFNSLDKQQRKRNSSFTIRKIQPYQQKHQETKSRIFQNDFINTKLTSRQIYSENSIMNHSQKILDRCRLPKISLAKLNNVFINFQEAIEEKVKTIQRIHKVLKSNSNIYSRDSSPRDYYQKI